MEIRDKCGQHLGVAGKTTACNADNPKRQPLCILLPAGNHLTRTTEDSPGSHTPTFDMEDKDEAPFICKT